MRVAVEAEVKGVGVVRPGAPDRAYDVQVRSWACRAGDDYSALNTLGCWTVLTLAC